MGQEISRMVHVSDPQFIESSYQDILDNLEHKDLTKILKKEFTEQDIYHIKENIYNLDFWISKIFFRALPENKIILKKDYSDIVILGIFATIRETLFGILIYLTYLRDETMTKTTNIQTELLLQLYIKDILHLDEYYIKKISKIINDLQADFNEILKHWIEIDDNKEYLKIAYENRSRFTGNKTTTEIKKKITSEDVIWFS